MEKDQGFQGNGLQRIEALYSRATDFGVLCIGHVFLILFFICLFLFCFPYIFFIFYHL